MIAYVVILRIGISYELIFLELTFSDFAIASILVSIPERNYYKTGKD
jgi:hypothetical protein